MHHALCPMPHAPCPTHCTPFVRYHTNMVRGVAAQAIIESHIVETENGGTISLIPALAATFTECTAVQQQGYVHLTHSFRYNSRYMCGLRFSFSGPQYMLCASTRARAHMCICVCVCGVWCIVSQTRSSYAKPLPLKRNSAHTMLKPRCQTVRVSACVCVRVRSHETTMTEYRHQASTSQEQTFENIGAAYVGILMGCISQDNEVRHKPVICGASYGHSFTAVLQSQGIFSKFPPDRRKYTTPLPRTCVCVGRSVHLDGEGRFRFIVFYKCLQYNCDHCCVHRATWNRF